MSNASAYPPCEISVTILSLNSERYLHSVLEALKPFAEIVVLDCGSKDRTREIALTFDNVQFFETPFRGFGDLHRSATKLASFDWILSVDSDEILSPELVEEICTLRRDPGTIYAFCRDNYFRGKRIWTCGWSPDWIFRLYNRRKAGFDDRLVHEKVCGANVSRHYLTKGRARHFPYHTLGDFLEKMQRYTSLFATQNSGKRTASIWTALGHGWFAFIRSYLVKGGFLQGFEGYFLSTYAMHTAYYKYLKLRELSGKPSPKNPSPGANASEP